MISPKRPILFAGSCLFAFSLLSFPASAQSVVHGGGKAWTAHDIYVKGGPIGEPPRIFLWSPDGKAVTYLSHDTEHGQPDDVIQVNAADGAASVLVPQTKLAAIYGAHNDERDRDHRARYGTSSYHWSPDSKHMLFDNSGTLWLFDVVHHPSMMKDMLRDSSGSLWVYDLARSAPVKLANTGAGSGDDPKFAPDGKSVSFVRDRNLYVMTLSGHRETALTHTTADTLLNGQVDWVYEEELAVRSNYFWSPDSQHIVYLQMDEAKVPTYPIVDWIPTHSTTYEQRYPQPGDPNPNVRVGIVGANGGETLWLNIPLSANNDYIPRFGWLDAHHVWVEVLDRDQRHTRIYFADADTGKIRKVMEETSHEFTEGPYDIKFLNDGQFLWTSWRDGHTHLYLYKFDANDPMAGDATLVRQVTHGDWEVLKLAGVDKKQGIVYYTSNETDPRQQMLWEIHLEGSGKKMLSTQPGVHYVNFSPDGTHYVDVNSSLTKPPVASVCSVNGGCAPFWQSRPLDGYKLVQPLMITGKTADGTTLYGSLLLPPDMHGNASVPLIVNPYGGPQAQTVRDQFGGAGLFFDEELMQHGFAVLHVDNRGMGNRGRAFEEFSYRNFGPVQLKDQLTMIDQVLAAHPQLDPHRMGWWGWSWGGTFTLYAMTHSDRFASGVDVAPVTNWRLYDSIYTERYLGLPAQNEQVYHDDSVINYAAHLHGNLLMVHGTGDDNVHMQNTIQMIQQFVNADIPYRLLLYPRKTHSIAGTDARTHLFNAILNHFVNTLHPDE